MPDPHRIRLTGEWQVIPVPLDFESLPDAMAFADAIAVPECAHLQPALYPDNPYWGDHLRTINEQAWVYRRTFTAPLPALPRARLRFEGVDYFASVWLNDQFIGQHEGHFAPFAFDVSEALRPGEENTLNVRVSSPWDAPNPRGSYPINHVIRGLVKGHYEHGEGVIPPNVNPLGIWRPVWLVLDAGVSLDRVRIRTRLNGTVDLCFTLSNATGQVWQGELVLDIAAENHDGPGLTTSKLLDLPPGTYAAEYTVRLPAPHPWWPWDHGRPDLYRLNAHLRDEAGQIISTLTETFGLRDVRLDRAPDRFTYWINERPVFVRGSSYMPGVYLSLCDRAALARDLALAREAHLNLLRVHIHVSPPDLYDLCDRAGMLIWQDFELNWVQDPSPEFETRARAQQRAMIDLLGNHPAIITWACHNEPTMVMVHRDNLERHPDPVLYADAMAQDPTRPVFLCSGQLESDWQRSGDAHTYYGALWTADYTDVYRHSYRLNTEFGAETPAVLETLQQHPEVWGRLKHLEGQIDDLWTYQAELIQFHVEHLRRLRTEGSAGYIHFWLADLVPQVGCGVLDARRQPKGSYEALRRASQPLHVALEHDGRRPRALWIFNDTPHAYPDVTVTWQVRYDGGSRLLEGQKLFDIAPNAAQQVMSVEWPFSPKTCTRIDLTLQDPVGAVLATNTYHHPFRPTPRPRGYPWKFDPVLGCKVFDRPGAPSLADQSANRILKLLPLAVRERAGEWALRQQLQPWLLSIIARLATPFVR